MTSRVSSLERQVRVATCVVSLLLIDHSAARAQSEDTQKQIAHEGNKQLQAEFASATSGEESPSEATDHTGTPALTNANGSLTSDVLPQPQTNTAEEKAKGYLDLYCFAELDIGYNYRTIDPYSFDVMRPSKLPLAKFDPIYADPFPSVDVYTKQRSVGVNALQLGHMCATLANNGINPAMGEEVLKAEDVPHILSTMTRRVSMTAPAAGPGTWVCRQRAESGAEFWQLSRGRERSLCSLLRWMKQETASRRKR